MKKFILLLAIVLLFTSITFCLHIQNEDSITSLLFLIEVDDNVVQKISLYKDCDKYYAFLPSYTNLNTMSVFLEDGGALFLDGKNMHSQNSFSDIIIGKEYSLEIKTGLGFAVNDAKLIFLKGDNVATLSLTLVDGTMDEVNAHQETAKTGRAVLINPNQTIDYAGNFKEIHGRGNSTWLQPKKSYSLEFPTDVDLLDMGMGDGWVLMANSFDESSLRNKLVYDFSKQIDVPFAVDSEYVDLYIDDTYYGLYLLAERVQVGDNRININDLSNQTQSLNTSPLKSYPRREIKNANGIIRGFDIPNNPADITGGYLFQIEHHNTRILSKESLVQTANLSFSLSSPKYASIEQAEYLYEYLNSIENNIRNNILDDLNLLSFVKFYLIQEAFANRDNCSFFFYKDSDFIDEKLYACAIWDMDLSIGNAWLARNQSPSELCRNKDNWFEYLYNNTTFKSMLLEQYAKSVRPLLKEKLKKQLIEYKAQIQGSFHMDKYRWNAAANIDSYADKSQQRFETLDEHINYIADYMEQRVGFLDSEWLANDAN